MPTVQDLSPKLPGLQTADQELYIPPVFQDVPNQVAGGFLVGSHALTQGKVTISGVEEAIRMGDATSPTEGIGIYMGDDGQSKGYYDFRIGDPKGVYLMWDASAATFSVTGLVPKGGAASDVNTNVTTIDGGKITTASITATQLNVTNLSAITANMGTLTAGTISGGLLTTGGVNIVGNGMVMDNNKTISFKDTGGSFVGAVSMNTSNQMLFYNTGGQSWLGSTNDMVKLVAYNSTVLEGHSDGSIYVNSPIYVGGVSKTAIVPTSKGYNALYCAEAPEVWFFDFCKTKQSIDPMFLEVTEGEMKFIQCDDGTYQVWRRRKGYGNTRFSPKTQQEFDKNNQFWATPQEQAMHQQFAMDRDNADILTNNIDKHMGNMRGLQVASGKGKPLQ